MTTQAQSIIQALYPLGLPAHLLSELDDALYPHLSDEEVSERLDKEDKHRRRARKAADTRKQKEEKQA